MKKIITLILLLVATAQVKAQFIKERSIDVSIGMGISSPNDEYDVSGTGFYAQGEYVFHLASWIDLRPYAGLIFTKMSGTEIERVGRETRSTANAFLFGGKTRITAPIPWVAPYLEIGVGGSVGSFETYTPYTRIEDHGLLFHIPFTMGVGLGPGHRVNLEFTYYFHDSVQQYSGAAAVGLSIPLEY